MCMRAQDWGSQGAAGRRSTLVFRHSDRTARSENGPAGAVRNPGLCGAGRGSCTIVRNQPDGQDHPRVITIRPSYDRNVLIPVIKLLQSIAGHLGTSHGELGRAGVNEPGQ